MNETLLVITIIVIVTISAFSFYAGWRTGKIRGHLDQVKHQESQGTK